MRSYSLLLDGTCNTIHFACCDLLCLERLHLATLAFLGNGECRVCGRLTGRGNTRMLKQLSQPPPTFVPGYEREGDPGEHPETLIIYGGRVRLRTSSIEFVRRFL